MGLHSSFWALALYFSIGNAFQNSSPFFAFSSRPFASEHGLNDFTRASSIHELISSDWLQCDDRDLYVIVSQPGALAADYQSTRATPYLQRALFGANRASSQISISDSIGALDVDSTAGAIAKRCGYPRRSLDPTGPVELEDVYPQILTVAMPELSTSPRERLRQLQQHDAVLNAILEGSRPHSHTVLYLTSPNATDKSTMRATSQHLSHHKHGSHRPQNGGDVRQAHATDGMKDDRIEPVDEALHADLKRSLSSRAGRRDGDENDDEASRSRAALFEKYNFLNEGIFMGGVVTLILLTILYVGLLAVSSIEITPFAFSKEMGPQNQKKQG